VFDDHLAEELDESLYAIRLVSRDSDVTLAQVTGFVESTVTDEEFTPMTATREEAATQSLLRVFSETVRDYEMVEACVDQKWRRPVCEARGLASIAFGSLGHGERLEKGAIECITATIIIMKEAINEVDWDDEEWAEQEHEAPC
jgi:hypothetical protein